MAARAAARALPAQRREQLRERGKREISEIDETSAVDKGCGGARAADGERRKNQQDGGADERGGQRHGAGSLSRTPRPRPYWCHSPGSTRSGRLERADELHQRIDVCPG